ncbi:hypothetical protein [Paracoccus sp. IB05]|uniref:hypothetical protein n=1 Tax=Paracoccus sp. IB05 TaxID=2779367 RepID=UPI0018E8B272|nr:hypothetical protein [Paracoccus sp. IB05]MBJ2149915.1 hypothetical protein [Paracoccus sp. IB05]
MITARAAVMSSEVWAAAMAAGVETRAMPQGDGPWLIGPGGIGQRVVKVQFIAPDRSKNNILKGMMGGASHLIAT